MSPAFAGVTIAIYNNNQTFPPNVVIFRGAFITLKYAGSGMDVDGNGTYDALTDSILMMRYLFGLRGASLIANAIGANVTRTTAREIEDYLQANSP